MMIEMKPRLIALWRFGYLVVIQPVALMGAVEVLGQHSLPFTFRTWLFAFFVTSLVRTKESWEESR